MTFTTTPEGFKRAGERLSGDWDAEPVCSVHLPQDVAQRLLAERGWHYHDLLWFPPHLPFDGTYLNGYREGYALAVALIAENS